MERAAFGTILELREEKHEAGRNVATSGQHEEEVNKRQRRDVSTSRLLNVVTLQCRDVSLISSS